MLYDATVVHWLNCLAGACPMGAIALWLTVSAACAVGAVLAGRRAMAAVWTLRAVALSPKVSRILARWVKSRSYSDEDFFRADCAGEAWVERRRAGIARLTRRLSGRPRSRAWADSIRDCLSDLRFTDASRVPFP